MNTHFFAMSGFADKILNWYDKNARTLPWRSVPGDRPDAYHVWLSEIMLQQTTVATVGPYFEKFLTNWPTIKHLAASSLDDILTAWAGLGYYARARNLHKCAVAVCHEYGGTFPEGEEQLRTLPGIGDYTAAAITAIAFGQPAVVVDGNIERIISRIFRVQEELPKGKKIIRERAGILSPSTRAGDYAQALMDIGATVCTPKKPKCDCCPVAMNCAGFEKGDFADFPKKAPKKTKPTRRGKVYWIEKPTGEILMRRRPETGLLGGMMEFPSTPWSDTAGFEDHEAVLFGELGLRSQPALSGVSDVVKHTFTHFHLQFHPIVIMLDREEQVFSNEVRWIHPADFGRIALPTLMKKVVTAVELSQAALPLL